MTTCRRLSRRITGGMIVALCLTSSLLAESITWIATSGDFTTPSNWSANRVPGPGDSAIIASGTFTLPASGTLTADNVSIQVPYNAPTDTDTTLVVTGTWTFEGPASLAAGRWFSVQGGGSVTFNGTVNLDGANLSVSGPDTKLSFPHVTSYVQPDDTHVRWLAGDYYSDNTGCELNFPALTSISGAATTRDYSSCFLDLISYRGASINFPVLTSITARSESIDSADSGVRLFAQNHGFLNAPILSSFNDLSPVGHSSLNADSNGILSLPLLIAPSGVQLNLNALSNPQQFTSLAGTYSIRLNAGVVSMAIANLSSVTDIYVSGPGTKLSFPHVTSYVQPDDTHVRWQAGDYYSDNTGCQLNFPALTSISGAATTRDYSSCFLDLISYRQASLNLPALTSITARSESISTSDSGVRLFAQNHGFIHAPLLSSFNDLSPVGHSSLNADSDGILSLPLLTAPSGVQLNLNALSNPQQFTSLAGTYSIRLNAGVVSMAIANLSSVTDIYVSGPGTKLSFPHVTSYVQPDDTHVRWQAGDYYSDNTGCQLNFPALTSISGAATTRDYSSCFLDLISYRQASLNLPALTSITARSESISTSDSGVRLFAQNHGFIHAPLLSSFNDLSPVGHSSVTTDTNGVFSAPLLKTSRGVSFDLGGPLTIPEGNAYLGAGTIHYGLNNNGLVETNVPGSTLSVQGSVTNAGVLRVLNGSILSIAGSLTLNPGGIFALASSAQISLTGSLLGEASFVGAADPAGTLLLTGAGTTATLQLLEAMSQDRGLVAAGFAGNFVFGTLSLANTTYVRLVDQSRNTSGTAPECLYANSVLVPAGCTLDLNGLKLYARAVRIAGTVLNGSISQLADSGPLTLGVATPGSLSTPGELDEWTFFGRANHSVSIQVNPGSSGLFPALSPLLHWANIQLLDAQSTVLATMAGPTAEAITTLANIPLPVDGTYKIRINAPTAHLDATGNYTVAAFDVTPVVRTLNLDQPSAGTIATPFGLDQWTFSALAGQQIKFSLLGSSNPALAFRLAGPGGYIAFEDLSADSPLLNLPTSGSYTLTAYGPGGETGNYRFSIAQTSITPLALATPYTGTWAGSGQAQLFSVAVGTGSPLSVALTDLAATNHTEVYARFGAPPTRQTYDFAAAGSGASQSLLIPSANAGTWYVLVYGESIPASSGSYTLEVRSRAIVLSSLSTTQAATNVSTTVTLHGAGFGPGTTASFIAADGTVYPATVSLDLTTQITVTVAANTLPAGNYTVRVTRPDGSIAEHPSAITFQSGQAQLKTNIILPDPIGRHVAAIIYVDYANVGTAPMPAPLLILGAKNPSGQEGALLTLDPTLRTAGFWTSATPAGYSQSVQILAGGATPGILQPGESRRVPVFYAGWIDSQWDFSNSSLDFSLRAITLDDATPVDWSALESTLQPSGVSSEAWHIMYAGLLPRLGTTSGGYVGTLNHAATYLGRLGHEVTDVSKLWSFTVATTRNIWPLPSLGDSIDASLPIPGALSFSVGRTFGASIPGRFRSGPFGFGWSTSWQQRLDVAADGTVTLTTGGGGVFVYQPDSRNPDRYFSPTGDHSTLATSSAGWVRTAVDGTATEFNGDGSLRALRDLNGNTITATYAGGRLTRLTASSGATFELTYNSAGLVSTLTDSAGRVTAYTYDVAQQHLLSVRAPNGETTTYAYQTAAASPARHALTSIGRPDGTHQLFTYDSRGRLATTSADGGTQIQTFGYADGQVSLTDATGGTTNLFFDENGQLTKQVDPLGSPTYYEHDATFNLVEVTNAIGAVATYDYNTRGQMISATDFLGGTTRLTYSGPGNRLTALSDANRNPTLYRYSTTGNLTSTTYANGRSAITTYDPLGEAISFINPAGQAIQLTRNAAGQLARAAFPDGTSYSYVYNSRGDLTSATDEHGTIVITYDPVTHYLTKIAYPNDTSLTYSYDSGGRRTQMVDHTGFTARYTYDAAGRLAGLKDGDNAIIVTYAYDAAGRLSLKTNGNGTYTTYEYDAVGRVLHLVNHAPDGTVNSRFDDTYDLLGLKTSEATLDGTWTYAYDAIGQLVRAIFVSNDSDTLPDQDLAYNYDAMGNRLSTVINGVTTVYVPNKMNQYVSIGGVPQGYDANGNLISEGDRTYAYNIFNQLVSAAETSTITTYAYNSIGQRIRSVSAGHITEHLIDPAGLGNVVSTYKNGNLVENYTYGVGLASRPTSSTTQYYDFDTSGGVSGTSLSNGDYTKLIYRLPFGEPISTSSQNFGSFQFVGQFGVQMETNGLIFMRARFYSPLSGVFTSQDPMNLNGGDINLYRYTFNNPIQFNDPSGLTTIPSPVTHLLNFTKGWNLGWNLYNGNFGQVAGAGLGAFFGSFLGPGGAMAGGFLGGLAGSYLYPPPGGENSSGSSTGTANAVDPNELHGPAGYGALNYVSDTSTSFPYRILFENKPAATAPAQSVTITNPLDPRLDWSTFQLTGFGFGDVNHTVPADSQHYQTTLSVTYNGETFLLEIEAGIRTATGQVYARFQSLDPDSGLPPANVLTGFLPPEDGTGRGQGYLTYTIAPKAGLPTGTTIPNVAVITFDAGISIATNQVNENDPTQGTDPAKEARVTIDADAPVATIASRRISKTGNDYLVSWSGTDTGAGVTAYDVYVRADNGDWTRWLSATSALSGTWKGQVGRTYTFYTAAADGAGKTQPAPTPATVGTAPTTAAPTAQRITFAQPLARTYGDPPTVLNPTANSGLPVTLTVVSGPATLGVDGRTLTLTGAGKVVLRATQSGNVTYKATAAVTRTLTVNKRSLAVSGIPASRLVRASNPVLTLTFSGFVNGDDEADLDRKPSPACKAAVSSAQGSYPITFTGGLDNNYAFTPGPVASLTVLGFGGTYEALLVDPQLTPLGKLTLTVPTNAFSYSGTLTLAGETKAASFKSLANNPLRPAADTFSASVSILVTISGTAYDLELDVHANGTFAGTLDRDGLPFATLRDGSRVSVFPKGQIAPGAGANTLALHPAYNLFADGPLPGGSGHATASIALATGVLTVKGSVADGMPLTATLKPTQTGYHLWANPYGTRALSFLAGRLALQPHPDQTRFPGRSHIPSGAGLLVWEKAPLPDSTLPAKRDRSYRDGFGPLGVPVSLDPWLPPSPKASASIPAGTLAQRLGLASSPTAPGTFSLSHDAEDLDFGAREAALPFAANLAPSGALTVPGASATSWTIKLTPATGAFSGSFVLSDQVAPPPAKPTLRTVHFSGTLRQTPDDDDPVIATGFFLLPSLDKTSEHPSGEIRFSAP